MRTPPQRVPFVALLLVAASSLLCVASSRAAAQYVITEHSAVGDGATVNTKAIQNAIDACAATGGGVIVVPKGTFLSGALYFKPGVNLELEKGAVLKSTTVMADFPPLYTSWEGIERYWTSAFLNFIGMKDVVVSGEGTIDGSGLAWPGPGARRGPGASGGAGGAAPAVRPPPPLAPAPESLPQVADVYPTPLPTTAAINFARDPAHLPSINAAGIPLPGGAGRLSPPRAIVFQDCTNVRVSGVHLKNQARWGFVFIYCRKVVAENLNVHIDAYIPSSDGIDVCSCQDVRISGCDIACTDDNITIKAGKDADGLRVNRPSENITISDCTFGSGGGVAMGSEVSGSIRHVLVERCTFTGTDSAARIKSQPSRGGVIEDIVYRDIRVTDVKRAFSFELEWRMVPPLAPPAKTLTVVRNIRLINFSGTAQAAGVIQGLTGSPILDLKIENSKLTAQRGLVLSNTQDPDLSGLELKVAQGEPIVRRDAGASVPSAVQPWRQVTVPTVAEAAAAFPQPPTEYGAIHWAIWGGPQTKARIIADIERIHANGGGVYMINNSQRVQPKYLSPEYMDLVKTVVQECKQRGMKVWIETDCGYPDGFAGGLISRDYPQLGMQGILTDARCTVGAGQTLDLPLPVDTLGILAYPRPEPVAPDADAAAPTVKQFSLPADGNFKYTAPRGGAGELTVQLPNADVRYSVAVGEPFSIPVPPGTKDIFLTMGSGNGGRGRGGRGGAGAPEGIVVPIPADGHLTWTAPAGTGSWEIGFIRHAYRTSPTRNDNGEDGGATKDTLYTLIDFLDPVATHTFMKLIYDTYEKAVGDEFGKTVLGFRGDETDYSGVTPWTPKLLETFQKQKGYDLKPYIPFIFGGPMTPEAQRAKADYWDVWSGMFRDNFYKPQEEWCNARNMEYMMHLNHEETMMALVNSEGSFWRDMHYVGVPGVDNLGQIGPGIIADFPKLAASAAHVFGRALAWDEEGGGPNQAGKFVADYQLVRGINYMNIRGLNAAPPADSGTLQDPASAIGHYVSRAQYLMSIGRPATQVALFHPTDSMWFGDRESDTATVKLVTELLEHQIDFDHMDADSLTTVCTLEGGGLKNLSGQVYRAVIVPTSTVIQQSVLERLRAFAAAGGKAIFVGRTPTMIVGRTFLNPEAGVPDLSFATLEPTAEITAKVIAALPLRDVKLDAACPSIKYLRRSLKDGEVYFFFNESAQTQARTATLVGTGQVQIWDAADGTIHPLAGVAKAAGTVDVPLMLAAQEARVIVIGALPAGAGDPVPTVSKGQAIADLAGDWSVTLGEKQMTTSLKTWEEIGAASFAGTGIYQREFTAAVPPDKRVYLDLGNAHEIVRVRLNGAELPVRPWPPYLWEVTQAIRSGGNSLEVQVRKAAPSQQRGGFGAGGPGGRPGGTGAPGQSASAAPGAPAGAADGVATSAGMGAPGRAGAYPGGPAGNAGRGGPTAAVTAVSGLLGPVRLLAQ